MNRIKTYKKNDSITNFKCSRIKKTEFLQPVDETFEGEINYKKLYIPIEYPVRRYFKDYIQSNTITKQESSFAYSGFENNKVDFSTFLGTPHILEMSAYTTFYLEESTELDIVVKLCGEANIELNGTTIAYLNPLTRVIPEEFKLKLQLECGANDFSIHLRDLTERDVNFSFEIVNISDIEIKTLIEVEDLDKLTNVENLLTSFAFESDLVNQESIKYTYDKQYVLEDLKIAFDIRHNDIPYSSEGFTEENNPIQASLNEKMAVKFDSVNNKGELDLSDINDFSSFVLLKYIESDMYVVRRLYLSKYTQQKADITSLTERKEYALEHIACNGKDSMMKVYAKMLQTDQLDEETKVIFNKLLTFIRDRNDCADFEIIGLQKLYSKFKKHFDVQTLTEIEDVLLGFRYWTDEPGRDVMWYFSENHALSFHTAQFISGNLFENEIFCCSGRLGSEQLKIAKKRLLDWFGMFNEFGLGEWNSTTYIPIDLNALLALYDQEYDTEIHKLAKIALDYCFKTIENNFTGSLMSSSYGRVYETELKAMELGELAFITWIMWNDGFINWSSRSTGMLCISNYYYDYNEKLGLIEAYEGHANIHTINYKYKNASISSVNEYYPNEKGLQQHVFNVTLPDQIQIWINHPGELCPSGEGRPSYWAGNRILPQVCQNNNSVTLTWDLSKELVQFVHLYYPGWKCHLSCEGEIIKIEKDDYTLCIATNNRYELTQQGANQNREIKFYGAQIEIKATLTMM